MADIDFSKMKVADLKKELKIRNLSTVGNKNELQERLQMALLDNDGSLEDTAISEELDDDVLNDDELDEEEKSLGLLDATHEDVILSSPKITEKSSHSPEEVSTQRKIVLKRKISTISNDNSSTTNIDSKVKTSLTSQSEDESDKSKVSSDADSSETEKKVVKLSELTAKDRLELRMKRFGGANTVNEDAKKLARAERFSGNGTESASIDVLKKRAQRFGGSVSSTLSKVENQEKLIKRQERFGATGASISKKSNEHNSKSATGKTIITMNSDYAEKAKLRLERFKTDVK